MRTPGQEEAAEPTEVQESLPAEPTEIPQPSRPDAKASSSLPAAFDTDVIAPAEDSQWRGEGGADAESQLFW